MNKITEYEYMTIKQVADRIRENCNEEQKGYLKDILFELTQNYVSLLRIKRLIVLLPFNGLREYLFKLILLNYCELDDMEELASEY